MSQEPMEVNIEEYLMDTEEPGKKFQMCGKKFHLTYAGHLDHQQLLAFLKTAAGGKLKWYSIVWEIGTKTVDYPHTHVAFESGQKITSRSCKKFDFQPGPDALGVILPIVHPNIRMLTTDEYVSRTWKYHEKAPIKRTVSDFCPVRSKNWMVDLQKCSSLSEACEICSVAPRTVACVQALMNARDSSQIIPDIVGQCSWTLTAPSGWKVLFLTGGTGLGKTRWALAQFNSPLLVSHLEDLKLFRQGQHDGIVFDDISFAHLTSTVGIHLLDWEMPRTLNVKHGSVTIPAETRKIFTSNSTLADTFPPATDKVYEAYERRVKVIRLTGKTFSDAPAMDNDVGSAFDTGAYDRVARNGFDVRNWEPLDFPITDSDPICTWSNLDI